MTSRLGFGWAIFCLALSQCPPALAQPLPPQLTAPVNDFAHVIDASSVQEIDRRVRALEKATGDVVVVAAVRTFQPYGDIKEYAVKMFQNGGKGIGARGKRSCPSSAAATSAADSSLAQHGSSTGTRMPAA